MGLLAGLATCFSDYRNRTASSNSVRELVSQRVYGLALLVGKRDLTGDARRRAHDQGYALAGSSTR